MTLEQSSPEVQLAVDLIYLLECNGIPPDIALAALEIVKRDFQGKLEQQSLRPEE
ncbi:pleiotropic regulatory protein RsmS [Xenorhabdus entomophaga]|uniref:pleiotropic regulatory protein RsmS n=1 Tax=Xenorhabdus entomophaga TaxID=3136257 RepID=UPI0030F3D7C1